MTIKQNSTIGCYKKYKITIGFNLIGNRFRINVFFINFAVDKRTTIYKF